MIPAATFAACLTTLFIGLLLPLVILIVFAVRNRKQGVVSAWLIGAAGFFVTQMLIRLPVLNFLQSQSWFALFAQNRLFLYAFALAFTAGLFELAGRAAAAWLMRRRLSWKRSLAAGLGHGGIEAMLLVGVTYLNNLLYLLMIQTGTFDAMVAQSAALGADISQLEMIRQQLISTPPSLFLLAGFERLLAMTGHLAMSALICYGMAHRKMGVCILLCLGLHTLMDLTAGLSLVWPANIAYPVIYGILTVMAMASILILTKLHRKWKTPAV